MHKNLIPTYYSNTIYDLNISKLKEKYEILFIDLDNTLVSPYTKLPDNKVIDLINRLKENSFKIYIISNNNENRVLTFAQNLSINYLYKLKKPNVKKLKKCIHDNDFDIRKCVVIGDQVMTDVLIANRLYMDVIMLNPLTKKDEPITFFPRLLDKYYKHKIFKKKLSKEF